MDPISNVPVARDSVGQEMFSLTTAMRDACASLHQQVESRPFFQLIQAKTIQKPCYVQYLADLKCIYGALELALNDHHLNPSLGPLCIAAIFREKRIAADLKAFGNGDVTPSLQARAHADHISHISQYSPILLIAHAYTRYLGDLFGGQYVGRTIAEMWGDECSSFYAYSELLETFALERPAEFASQYRAILNGLPLNNLDSMRVVEEAVVAFQYADDMVKELVP